MAVSPKRLMPIKGNATMKATGSVLIVVLGLLAILAVVGITFVTMSSIDRSTAANFALQTQFGLAADGAVEFACHSLVQDLWVVKKDTRDYYKSLLMCTIPSAPGPNNEPWDAPGTDTPSKDDDNWLASTATAGAVPRNLSFGGPPVTLYGLSFGGTALSMPADAPDNLGTGAKNGIWLPELAFPYEGGLIRTSITIQDHASLINLNAHGNKGVANSWPLADLVGWGYFISDVNPAFDGKIDPAQLLIGNTNRPGRWGPSKRAPGNPNSGVIFFENPAAAFNMDGTPIIDKSKGDCPLNLDEEFDLRRIPKTGDPAFPTRIAGPLNPIIPILSGPPAANSKLRLAYTTVGWTSEIRGDWNSSSHLLASQGNALEGNWSARKADLNFDKPEAIYNALYYGFACLSGSSWGAQFAVNVVGFRDGSPGCGIKGYALGSIANTTAVAASRQPILSKVSAQMDGGPVNGQQPWKVTVQIISPWGNDNALQADNVGLTTQGMRCEVNGNATNEPIPNTMQAFQPLVLTATGIMGGVGLPLTDALKTLTIRYQPANFGSVIPLDQLEPDDIVMLSNNLSGIFRPIFTETESRGASDPSPTTVLYVGPWEAGAGDINTFAKSVKSKTSGIPIRFPRAVPQGADGIGNSPSGPSNLPPRAPAALKPFKAIARLGDIDQILCPITGKGPADFWPWVPRVAKSAANVAAEAQVKFNWDDPNPAGGVGGAYSRLNAANLLAVGGPWKDNIDNDGDGTKDTDDKGTYDPTNALGDLGRFAGPELRVAGKVNLNSATSATLLAMESGLGLPQGCLSSLPAANPRKVFKSTAEARSYMNLTLTDNPNARSPLEQRDEAFNRISNIASVRSDTYSIYGTVQYGTIETATKTFRVHRERRFWALVDRSPSLAYSPTDPTKGYFIHPRIMNFQWMN